MFNYIVSRTSLVLFHSLTQKQAGVASVYNASTGPCCEPRKAELSDDGTVFLTRCRRYRSDVEMRAASSGAPPHRLALHWHCMHVFLLSSMSSDRNSTTFTPVEVPSNSATTCIFFYSHQVPRAFPQGSTTMAWPQEHRWLPSELCCPTCAAATT